MKTKRNLMKKLSLFAAAFAFCAVLTAKPIDANAALTTPTGLTQTDAYTTSSTCSIELEWNDTASYYAIETSLDRVNWTMQDPDWSLNYKTISNLTPGKTYFVRITPIENGTKGSPAVLAANTAPRSTSVVKQTAAPVAGTQLTLSWAPTAGATGYAIYYGTSSYFNSSAKYYGQTAGTSVTMKFTGKNSVLYVYVIPHRNGWTSSMYSSVLAVTAPTAPSKLWVAETDTDTKTVTFGYSPSSYSENTDGYEVEVYRVVKKTGKTKKLKKITVKGESVYKAKLKSKYLFTAGYKYRVRAYVTINGKNYPGSWSKYYYYAPCALIKGKLKNQTSSTAKLSWTKVLGAKSYTVYHKTSEYAKWKAVKKNVKGTSATVKYSKSSYYNYYCVKPNKAKIDKKNVNGPNPNGNNAYSGIRFKKVYY